MTDTVLPVSHLTRGPSSPEVITCWPSHQLQGITTYLDLETSKIPKPFFSSQLQNSKERYLLHHYDQIVAPNMAWADCQENPWRYIIIPLALESPPLLNAILAFAAKHINAVSFSASRESTLVMPVSSPDSFQQRAMNLLAREIQKFTTEKSSCASVDMHKYVIRNRSNAILATMLVLCNVETVWPGQFLLSFNRLTISLNTGIDSPIWQVHLSAARTVIASSEDTLPIKTPEDSTSIFLEQELFIANTFASTTNFLNFGLDEEFRFNTAVSKSSSIFIEFLKLLQVVTSLERQASTHPAVLADSGISPSGLRKLFEHARSRTLEMGKEFQVSGSHEYLHLSRTVNCFYHAGLIYSYRALWKYEPLARETSTEKDAQIMTFKFELFRALGFAETNKPTFAQDLVWPLFIAGTEATQRGEQEMVIAKLQQAMSETGFSNCQHAVEFLNALWQRWDCDKVQENELDWISFAREWTGQGKTFLVF